MYELEKKSFDATSSHKFRSPEDISQYLMRYAHLASGEFEPRKSSFGKNIAISDDNRELIQALENGRYKMMCFNDTGKYSDFEKCKAELIASFEKIFPDKSSFEK